MSSNITLLLPEGFEIANAFLQYGSAKDVSEQLELPLHEVVKTLQTPDVKRYLDGVYMDLGYRNRDKLASVIDKMIDAKLAEAEESGIYSSKDLLEIITIAHKMRMDEIKAQKAEEAPTAQTTVQIASFGESNYGRLMERLFDGKTL